MYNVRCTRRIFLFCKQHTTVLHFFALHLCIMADAIVYGLWPVLIYKICGVDFTDVCLYRGYVHCLTFGGELGSHLM